MQTQTGLKPVSYLLGDVVMQRSLTEPICSLLADTPMTLKPKSALLPVTDFPVLSKVLHFLVMSTILSYSWCPQISVKAFPNC